MEEDAFPPPTVETPYPVATSITVGDEYYKLSKWLPRGTYIRIYAPCPRAERSAGTSMVWGVNLGLNNVTNAVNMGESIMRAFADPAVIASGVSLERIEVGTHSSTYSPPLMHH